MTVSIGENWLETEEKQPTVICGPLPDWKFNKADWTPYRIEWIDTVEKFTTFQKADDAAQTLLQGITYRIVPRDNGWVIQYKKK